MNKFTSFNGLVNSPHKGLVMQKAYFHVTMSWTHPSSVDSPEKGASYMQLLMFLSWWYSPCCVAPISKHGDIQFLKCWIAWKMKKGICWILKKIDCVMMTPRCICVRYVALHRCRWVPKSLLWMSPSCWLPQHPGFLLLLVSPWLWGRWARLQTYATTWSSQIFIIPI